jgi:hypothetical protein
MKDHSERPPNESGEKIKAKKYKRRMILGMGGTGKRLTINNCFRVRGHKIHGLFHPDNPCGYFKAFGKAGETINRRVASEAIMSTAFFCRRYSAHR